MAITLLLAAVTGSASLEAPRLAYSADVVSAASIDPVVPVVADAVRVGGRARTVHSALGDEGGDVSVSTSITLATDYRFRGISLSGKSPALQAGIEVGHKSGIYGGVWTSTIANSFGSNQEIDLYTGWRGDVAGVSLDANVTGYIYPRAHGANYYEVLASAAKTLGPIEMKAGIGYVPDQPHTDGDNLYVYGQAKSGIPGTPFTLSALVGHENGVFAGPTGKKWDWSGGVDAVFDKFTIGLKYVDTNVRRADDPDGLAKAGAVVSFGLNF